MTLGLGAYNFSEARVYQIKTSRKTSVKNRTSKETKVDSGEKKSRLQQPGLVTSEKHDILDQTFLRDSSKSAVSQINLLGKKL